MQQHLMQMQPMMAADHIQQYLDENKSLILKIVESQNSGKLSECIETQARLQQNLMCLAAIAHSQPQPPSMHAQFPSSGVMQAGGAHYMQHHQQAQQNHQQAQQITPQSLMASARTSNMMYTQQPPYSALQQGLHGQLGLSSGGGMGLHMLQSEGGSAVSGGFPDFNRGSSGEGLHGRSKQELGTAEAQGGGSSRGQDGGETLYLKGADDGH